MLEELFKIVALQLFFIAIPFAYFKFKKFSLKKSLAFLSLPAHSKHLLKHSFYVFISSLAAIILLSIALHFGGVADDSQNVSQKVQDNPIIFAIAGLLLSPIAEELLFRGFLPKFIGFIPSSILFAVSHAGYGSYVEIIGALAIALIFSFYAIRYRDLKPLMAAHFLLNLFSIATTLL